ncbi:MAG TPA: peptidyl-prolyl cis-trans isomerase [Bacillota bacterium]|nr:peptidyl-prolyl cis-trans isomerase [Bacillota bacterium]
MKPWQRILIIVFGAVLILGLAVWGLWEHIDERWVSGPRVLARVGDETITQGQVNSRGRLAQFLLAQPGTNEELLEQLIDERLILSKAIAGQLLPADEEVARQTDGLLGSMAQLYGGDEARDQAMREARVTRADLEAIMRVSLAAQSVFAEVTREVAVSPEEVRAFYDQDPERHAQPLSVQVRHILVATQAEAEDVRRLILAGEDFAQLAVERSLDTGSREEGGQLPWAISPGDERLVPEFVAAAVALAEGELSEPVKTAHGYHIIRADSVTPARQPSFEEVEASAAEELLAERRGQAFEAWLQGRRDAAPVTYTGP